MHKAIDWTPLKSAAIAVRENAWAPYSQFRVGAALSAGGRIFTGCNVENVSYPVGICAERAALSQMVSAGFRQPEALVIAAGPLITPCGMCRQALAEFSAELPVLLVSIDNDREEKTDLAALFPSAFTF